MITRPSVSELLAGLVKNFEHIAQDQAADPRLVLRPALAVLDRITSEWAGWRGLLEADSADLRDTLRSLGRDVRAAVAETEGQTEGQTEGHTAPQVVQRLEADNRDLKQALVDAIEAFDLPAVEGASAAAREADAAILALLRRMLHREASVDVPAPRSAGTSGNPANASVSLEHLGRVLERFLGAQMPAARDIRLARLEPLPGGASREAWIFDVRWRDGEERVEACILMREPVASVLVSDDAHAINGTRRTVANEIRVIKAMEAAGLPVPAVLWHDPSGEWLERPFSVFRRLPGSADGAAFVGSAHVDRLLEQFIEILARLHRVDPAEAGLEFLGQPTAETAALEQVVQYERNFHAQRLEAFPATTYIIRWLKKHCPRAHHVGVVHGDYRLGNFLFQDDRIVAILDWEQVHIGDPVEEIAFMYWSLWSLETICPIEAFVRRYERATRREVDRSTLAYYRAFIEFKMLVVLFTGLKSFYATPEYQLHYGSAQTPEMIRDAQLRVIEALHQGGPTVAFDAYRKTG